MASRLAARDIGDEQRRNVLYSVVVLTNSTDHTPSITAVGNSDFADCIGASRVSIQCDNGATNPVTFTVQGSMNGTDFVTAGYRTDSAATYQTTGLVVIADDLAVVHLSPTEMLRYVRVSVSSHNPNGTVFTLYSET